MYRITHLYVLMLHTFAINCHFRTTDYGAKDVNPSSLTVVG